MIKHNPHTIRRLAELQGKRYHNGGYREAKARVPTRRQLEQWVERWGVHAQSEQCADEYEYEHWLSLRQELRAPSRRHSWLSGLPEWSSATVAASAHEDLPLALSELVLQLNMIVGGGYPDFGASAAGALRRLRYG